MPYEPTGRPGDNVPAMSITLYDLDEVAYRIRVTRRELIEIINGGIGPEITRVSGRMYVAADHLLAFQEDKTYPATRPLTVGELKAAQADYAAELADQQ